MRFKYQARDDKGELKKGIIVAPSQKEALSVLHNQGLFVTSLEEESANLFMKKGFSLFHRVSAKDLVLFSRRLSIMIKSKVPLGESLSTLSRQSSNYDLKVAIDKLATDVEGGMPLSIALSQYPKYFSSFFVNMVKVGESSGRLSENLTYLADYLERNYHIREKVKSAMFYPIIVLVTFIALFNLLIYFILPNLSKALEENVTSLPTITKIVFGAGKFFKRWNLLLLVLFIALLFLLWYFVTKTKKGQGKLQSLSLKIPLVSDLIKKIYMTRFSDNLSTLLSSGLPISQCLQITADVMGNNIYRNIVLEVKGKVTRGKSMGVALAGHPQYIYPLVVQMILIGEKTGTLDSSLKNVVNFYEDDINSTIDNLTNLIQPLLIIILGGLIGGLAISVFLPLYTTIGQIG